jgi:hypothetical protein
MNFNLNSTMNVMNKFDFKESIKRNWNVWFFPLLFIIPFSASSQATFQSFQSASGTS